jgi:hypothetical protein
MLSFSSSVSATSWRGTSLNHWPHYLSVPHPLRRNEQHFTGGNVFFTRKLSIPLLGSVLHFPERIRGSYMLSSKRKRQAPMSDDLAKKYAQRIA